MAVRKASQISCVTNEEARDSGNRLAVGHMEEKESLSSRSHSFNRLQAKVSSFAAFTGVHNANRAEKRREVCLSRCPFLSK